ncbi:hypothetical protein [Methylobacterium gregans]|uniref:Chemotaxis protein CheZ n=1 Tax=Methylobacterium gregans TaxID=374424 RepID=A0AA37HRF7_9HYPH|nr:hypothetical protein [Methylobacterium gregans]MDQ0523063.1 hypothetical protein [Methylobacterium gregans]GJD80241.1 hypothetical protein NBEOAGPD_3482 [Methylobacterium gregans]GLS56388.1 hypothetical protein GCM10007886_45730 [Methylobacterium gregans]
MSGSQSLTPYEPDAYEVIAQAMAESERGRWFLDEHARRNRGPDTGTLLDAIARLESAVTAQRPPDDLAHLRGNLLDMANAISRTKAEIAAISAPGQDQSRLGSASEALDAIVRTTERATSDILGAAEEVQEAAWLLRERGIEPEFCDRLDRHATQIYTACSFQDLTAQRTGRIVHTLRYLEDRLSSMIAIWDAEGERVPPAPERAGAAADLCQSDVDRFIDAEAPAIPVSPLLGATALDDDLVFVETPAEPQVETAVDAFDLDGMDAVSAAEAEEIAFGALEPTAEIAAVGSEAESVAAAPEIGLDTIEVLEETAEIDVQIVTVAEETAEAAPQDIEFATAEVEADAALSVAIDVPVATLEEPMIKTDEPALGTAESDDAIAEAMILPPVLEAAEDADEPAPARENRAGSAEPAHLDEIDLLSIEEKLALFS